MNDLQISAKPHAPSRTLTLWLIRESELTLEQVFFTCPRVGVGSARRGKPDLHHFPWVRGVRALTVLLLEAASLAAKDRPAILKGGHGSLAACLDYALAKNQSWLLAIFGRMPDKTPAARTILRRVNSSLKRPGNVHVYLHEQELSARQIKVYIDGAPVTDEQTLTLAAQKLRREDATPAGSRLHNKAAPAANVRCPACGCLLQEAVFRAAVPVPRAQKDQR